MVLRVHPVKTTFDIPDELYRRAKAEAALRGRRLKDLIEEGLRTVLDGPKRAGEPKSLAAMMKKARGTVDSGVPDLGSDAKHLTGFGRDARRHR